MMKSKDFVEKAISIAKNYKTLYIMGCFGSPMNESNKIRYCNNYDYNKQADRTKMIKAASADTFGFDCVCLIKGILWGWTGDTTKVYGGATYASNGVPDINETQMIAKCAEVSTSGWTSMIPGEVVWMTGHIGIYIGNGLAVECSPKWDNKVQITAVGNIGSKEGYNTRIWTKHGRLPYLDYSDYEVSTPNTTKKNNPTVTAEPKIIWDFLINKIGNAYGVAGLMGNLYAESGLIACNLQNTYNTKLGYTDIAYTVAVDNGTYTNFVRDSAGYGIAQWTYWSRKDALKRYADNHNYSIGDLTMQLEFLYKELSESYPYVLNVLKTAKSIREASNIVLMKYECPANQNESVQIARAAFGEKYYNQYATENKPSNTTAPVNKVTASKPAMAFDKNIAGTYKTTADLNMRDGAGTVHKILTTFPKGTAVKNYGYYTMVNNVKWYYVQATYKNTIYTGFCCSNYLTK